MINKKRTEIIFIYSYKAMGNTTLDGQLDPLSPAHHMVSPDLVPGVDGAEDDAPTVGT
jgi:hypothetical protein